MTKTEFRNQLLQRRVRVTFKSPWDGKVKSELLTLKSGFFEGLSENSNTTEREPLSGFNPHNKDPNRYLITWSASEKGWRAVEYRTVMKVGGESTPGGLTD